MLNKLLSTLEPYQDKSLFTLVLLGFSSGLPAPLVFSNLSIWLKDLGVSRTEIGLFALAATPYAINFLWAPLVDNLKLPLLHRLGRRKSWILFTQVLLMLALLLLASFNPQTQLAAFAAAVLLVTFVSATQDIAIDAYRIEILPKAKYGTGSAVAIWGWHLGGTLVGAAGGLVLAQHFGWQMAYQVLALSLLIAMVATLLSPEPTQAAATAQAVKDIANQRLAAKFSHLPKFISRLLTSLHTSFLAPFIEFTRRPGWLLVLVFIFVFKLGDALLGRMSGVFYRELGFSLTQIAEVAKLYGFSANLVGIFLGGLLVAKLGLLRALFLAGLANAITNLSFSWLAVAGQNYEVFILAQVSDSLTTGLVTVAFVAYLSSLCSSAYTATQYALLASLGNLARIWFSAASGFMVDQLDGNWAVFFLLTSVLALAGLPLLYLIMRRFTSA